MLAEPLRSIRSCVWIIILHQPARRPNVLPDYSLNPPKVWCLWKKYLQWPLHKHDKAWLYRFLSHGIPSCTGSARKHWCYLDTVQSSRHQYTKRAKHEEHVRLELLQCTAEASRSYLGEWLITTQMFIKFHLESSTFITHPGKIKKGIYAI